MFPSRLTILGDIFEFSVMVWSTWSKLCTLILRNCPLKFRSLRLELLPKQLEKQLMAIGNSVFWKIIVESQLLIWVLVCVLGLKVFLFIMQQINKELLRQTAKANILPVAITITSCLDVYNYNFIWHFPMQTHLNFWQWKYHFWKYLKINIVKEHTYLVFTNDTTWQLQFHVKNRLRFLYRKEVCCALDAADDNKASGCKAGSSNSCESVGRYGTLRVYYVLFRQKASPWMIKVTHDRTWQILIVCWTCKLHILAFRTQLQKIKFGVK